MGNNSLSSAKDITVMQCVQFLAAIAVLLAGTVLPQEAFSEECTTKELRLYRDDSQTRLYQCIRRSGDYVHTVQNTDSGDGFTGPF